MRSTVVPILLATNAKVRTPDDLAQYEHVRIVTYR
jgi:hypothetical protein